MNCVEVTRHMIVKCRIACNSIKNYSLDVMAESVRLMGDGMIFRLKS